MIVVAKDGRDADSVVIYHDHEQGARLPDRRRRK
jgi:hypothetical protein